MITEGQQLIGREVCDLVRKLNGLLEQAAEAGFRVDLDIVDVGTMEYPYHKFLVAAVYLKIEDTGNEPR